MPDPLYATLLGPRFWQLPAPVQRLHRPGARLRAQGVASIERGRHPLSRLVGWLMGFPAAAAQVPLRFEITVRDGAEHWQRHFGGHALASTQWAEDGVLCERIGITRLRHALELHAGVLSLRTLGVRAWGLPLPRWLWPRIRTAEFDSAGRYGFDVRAGLPGIGLVVRYSGWLQVEEDS